VVAQQANLPSQPAAVPDTAGHLGRVEAERAPQPKLPAMRPLNLEPKPCAASSTIAIPW
jgi:hypothetical protein